MSIIGYKIVYLMSRPQCQGFRVSELKLWMSMIRGGGWVTSNIGRPRSPWRALLAFRCGRFFATGAAGGRAPRSMQEKLPIMLCTTSLKKYTTILWEK